MNIKRLFHTLSLVTLYGCAEDSLDQSKFEDVIISEKETVQDSYFDQRYRDTAAVKLQAASINKRWLSTEPASDNYTGHYEWKGAFEKVWSNNTGAGTHWGQKSTTQPVVAGGTIYTLDTSGQLQATDLHSGDTKWQSITERHEKEGGHLTFDPASQTLYAAASSRMLYALTTTGEFKWQKEYESKITGAIAVDSSTVYVICHDNTLLALDKKTGKEKSRFEGVEEDLILRGNGRLALKGNHKIAGLSSGDLISLNPNSTTKWVTTITPSSTKDSMAGITHIYPSPVIMEDSVYASSFTGELGRYSLANGTARWKAPISTFHTPTFSRSHLFTIDPTGKLMAVNKANGKLRWLLNLSAAVKALDAPTYSVADVFWYRPLLVSGKLFVVNDQGLSYIINPQTGSVEKEFEFPFKVTSNPIVVDNKMILQSSRGYIYVYE